MRTRASRLAILLGLLGGLLAAVPTIILVILGPYASQGESVACSPGGDCVYHTFTPGPRSGIWAFLSADGFHLAPAALAALAGAALVWRGRPAGRALLVAAGIGLAFVGVLGVLPAPALPFLLAFPLALMLLAAAFIDGRPPLWRSVALTFVVVALVYVSFFI
jgi:hypothetical protein